VDFLVTVIDSKHDHFHKIRDFFINNPDILEKYNNLKRKYDGKRYDEYRQAKLAFLGQHGEKVESV
jgi:GrpB-like predicted nucleotidyltransferase (UPF0157 family)